MAINVALPVTQALLLFVARTWQREFGSWIGIAVERRRYLI